MNLSQQDLAALVTAFEQKTLPKEQWTHHAHLGVALLYLDKYGNLDTALAHLRTGIMAYNEHIGIPNTEISGYHETLTVFWLIILHEFSKLRNSLSLLDLFKTLVASPLGKHELAEQFYSLDRLLSIKARKSWVQPNKIPISNLQKWIQEQFS